MTRLSAPCRRLATVAGLVAALGAAASLTACNTVSGAGADVSAVGHGVSSGANTVANHM